MGEMHSDEAMLEHINLCSMPSPDEDKVADPESVVDPVDVSIRVVHAERGQYIIDLTNTMALSKLMQAFSLKVGWPARELRFFLRGFCILPRDTLHKLEFQEG